MTLLWIGIKMAYSMSQSQRKGWCQESWNSWSKWQASGRSLPYLLEPLMEYSYHLGWYIKEKCQVFTSAEWCPFWLGCNLYWKSLGKWNDYYEIPRKTSPYFKINRAELQLGTDFPCLDVYDRFQGQRIPRIIVIVPANCTDQLQPLDVSVNKAVKAFLRSQFQNWYASCVCQQMRLRTDGETPLVLQDLKMWLRSPLASNGCLMCTNTWSVVQTLWKMDSANVVSN